MPVKEAAESLFNSVIARRVACNAHNELYHFLMAVNQYGIEAVVQETIRLLMNNGDEYLTALRKATDMAIHMMGIATGEKTYQLIRNSMNNTHMTSNIHTATLTYNFR
ncbi:hypothetical protein ABT56_18350 [Photobacterium aquae]|uniref:Uncharacterized protein n=1 Tax=Photobacterium aquae TaxID=1195763 RepID=A0A0J1GVA6_9GAMM|nr:hypothetical protein [Photobacterium aquae]KLV03660.1 hypothetical protein ABT56_18350 [Photobacterium aquae]